MSRRLVLTLVSVLVLTAGRTALAQVPTDDQTVSDDAEVQGPTEDIVIPNGVYLLDPTVTGTSAPAPPWPTPCTMPPTTDTTRTLRGQAFNKPGKSPIRENEPGMNELPVTSHWFTRVSPLPAAQSGAVVIGRVMSGASYVSPDGTTAYSEYSLKIEAVLAPNANRAILAGDTIVTQRQAGLLQFRDGRLQWQDRVQSTGVPKRLGRYVLFLKWDSQADVFPIVTGYRLQGGHVVEPLDSVFTTYTGFKEDAFLDRVRAAIRAGDLPSI